MTIPIVKFEREPTEEEMKHIQKLLSEISFSDCKLIPQYKFAETHLCPLCGYYCEGMC